MFFMPLLLFLVILFGFGVGLVLWGGGGLEFVLFWGVLVLVDLFCFVLFYCIF